MAFGISYFSFAPPRLYVLTRLSVPYVQSSYPGILALFLLYYRLENCYGKTGFLGTPMGTPRKLLTNLP